MQPELCVREFKVKIVTIGVYGFDERGFFEALRRERVDTFCDIRFRRGVRGRLYAFANSRRLQARLAEMGISYLHKREVAPSPALRRQQAAADKREGIRKRDRHQLSPEFVHGFEHECLDQFKSAEWIAQLGPEAKVVALFCVEGAPSACHRSLVAQRLQRDLNLEVVHICPG